MTEKPFFMIPIFDGWIDRIKKVLNERFLKNANHYLFLIGNFCVYAFMLLYLVKALYMSIKLESMNLFFADLKLIVLIPIFHYLGLKLISSFEGILQKSPSGISPAPNQIIAALNILAGIFAPIFLIIMAVETEFIPFALMGLALMVLCFLWAVFNFFPRTLNLEVADQKSAGHELLGILNYFFKAPLKAFPAAYGLISILGTLVMFAAIILLLAETRATLAYLSSALMFYWFIILSPILVYIYSLLGQLMTGILKSLLDIHDK